MWKKLSQFTSPKVSFLWAGWVLPWLSIVALACFTYGLVGGLWQAPSDYQQGEVYRIIFIHVPAAAWSLGVYVAMSAAALVYLIWKLKVADIIAKLSAPIGASFTFLALFTGAIWGKPTWGTWWIWDARLTSELILLFIYAGVISLRSLIPEPKLAAQTSSALILVGMVNIPIVHYSVIWWQTLHQGPSILKLSTPSIAASMLYPLLAMLLAFFLYYLIVLMIGLRYEILKREQQTHWAQSLLQRKNS
jgi:heme exporter protein C